MPPSPSPSPSPSVPVAEPVTATAAVAATPATVRHDLLLYVNGARVHVRERDVQPEQTLLQFLRQTLKLTGTKLGCGEGGCGACTVMVSKFDVATNAVRHYSVNSCLTPVCAMDTCAVTTVEGVGSMTGVGHDAAGLHPVQQAIAESHGSQCGYCTPGFVMALYTMVKQREAGRDLTMEEIEHGMDGNLCRCTGYRPILDAAKSFGVDATESKCKGTCPGCPNQGKEPVDIEDMGRTEDGEAQVKSCSSNKIRSLAKKWDGKLDEKVSPDSFPQELQEKARQPEYLEIHGENVQWFAPVTLPQLLALKTQYPTAKISVGNTEMGIETKFKHLKYAHLINVNRVPELVAMSDVDISDAINQSGLFGPSGFEGVKIGAAATLTDVKDYLSDRLKTLPAYKTHTFTSMIKMLKWFASTHIRNVACLAGNIVTASPISDMNPLLAAMNAYVELRSAEHQDSPRYVNVREFFLAYRKVDLAPTEVITNVYVPYTKKWEYMLPFKQAKRREDDISIVTGGIRVELAPSDDGVGWQIQNASVVYGGMAPVTKAAEATEEFLVGKAFDSATIDAACDVIHQHDFILPAGVPGGMARYRESLCASFLYKFLVATTKILEDDCKNDPNLPSPETIEKDVQSAGDSFLLKPREPSHAMQAFGLETGGLTKSNHMSDGDVASMRGPVGDPLMHKSAYAQVSGEALYTDDIPTTPDTLHAVMVLSTCAHGLIKSIDASEALSMAGVRGFFDATVFENYRLGSNKIGAILKDEDCFASGKVVCVGQPVGMIVADSHEIATDATDKVKVVYEELPSIITIQDAIQAQSFFPPPHVIDFGNVEEGFKESDVILEGEFSMGGQEQFYFETNVSLCTPSEGGMKVVSSTQAATKAQVLVARVLGIHENRVVSTTKRIGGGFGGKETRTAFVSCATAVVAKLMKRPVKCLLERHVDMLATGGRHPFYAKYRVGVKKNGLLQALEVDLYNNAGYSLDLSMAVMDRALFHCENAYKIPHVRATGRACKTNMPTNTAFRGFGGPQGLIVAETYMDHIARTLNMTPEDLRTLNMYHGGEVTHFGQPLEDFDLRSLWQRSITKSDFYKKQEEVEAFNKLHRYKKRGVAIIPTKFGISFTAKFMNQGGALVHVYADGSVLVSHGGIEMGQGLHTKVIQVAARAFGIPHEHVHVEETCTSKVANTQPSAASMSTDLYGMATLDACEQILARLAPVRAQLGPDATFAQVANTAYMSRIDLSAHGFYIVPKDRCGYDFSKSVAENAAEGTAFNYFTTGVACTVVELDVLTGDFHMVGVDVSMDLGASINPAIDIGQIEGAFMQGFGLFAMEELVWGDDGHPWVKRGHLFTRGPGAYKIPSANDLPVDFKVWLDSGKKNKFAVHSSKAVGEPPLFLGSSAFFAVKEAIYAARRDAGLEGYFELRSPVTPERARMACQDHLLQKLFDARGENMATYQPSGSF